MTLCRYTIACENYFLWDVSEMETSFHDQRLHSQAFFMSLQSQRDMQRWDWEATIILTSSCMLVLDLLFLVMYLLLNRLLLVLILSRLASLWSNSLSFCHSSWETSFWGRRSHRGCHRKESLPYYSCCSIEDDWTCSTRWLSMLKYYIILLLVIQSSNRIRCGIRTIYLLPPC